MDKNLQIRLWAILLFSIAGVFIVDQNIKTLFVEGFRYYTECIDFILVYNKGVAFSMFASLGEYLKYIQLVLVLGVFGYIIYLKKLCYAFPTGIIIGGALSNIYDRFIHGGVVDMVYWHCGFDFAVFNFADVVIDIGVLWLLILNLKTHLCKN
ncbi:lipoprotein signal peptidase [Sulfurimonas marina]|uniref:Lipoprotein signal peptidase n=1 Tax=Sulfurimonas marina TaxID=2590551 RepID=A0A7M1AY59_9BACT|nr:signal peptidase II [Sulfurimonas marina]QOP42266.1 lipoprotein signal peptidase [Sulfurimonas marina]